MYFYRFLYPNTFPILNYSHASDLLSVLLLILYSQAWDQSIMVVVSQGTCLYANLHVQRHNYTYARENALTASEIGELKEP
jgi:hypothetical protein